MDLPFTTVMNLYASCRYWKAVAIQEVEVGTGKL